MKDEIFKFYIEKRDDSAFVGIHAKYPHYVYGVKILNDGKDQDRIRAAIDSLKVNLIHEIVKAEFTDDKEF